MSNLRIWGRMSSLNVRKVVWCAQELALDFQRTEAGGQFGVVKTPEYEALNPNALVPVIQDGDYVLWESNVIVRYLCAKYGAPSLATSYASRPPKGASPYLGRPGAAATAGTLYPTELPARFDAERWMDWQQTTLNPAGRDGFLQWVRTAPAQRDAYKYLQSVATTEPLLAMLDAHLAQQPFMVGDSFTMADIPIACEIHRWRALPLSDTAPLTPHLDRWYQVVSGRPTALGVLDQPLT